MTIFEKIIARKIPAKIIWEDEDAIAFHDVDPQAPVHVLIVPKKTVARLADATDEAPRCLANCFWLRATWRRIWSCPVAFSRDQLRT